MSGSRFGLWAGSLLSLVLVAAAFAADGRVVVDGEFSDWKGTKPAATDPAGDATGPFDVRSLRVRGRGSVVHLAMTLEAETNLFAGPEDAETLVLELAADGRRLRVDLRNRTYRLRTEKEERSLSWADIDLAAAPTYAATRYELRLDLSVLDVGPGAAVTLSLAGSDTLEPPVRFAVGKPRPDPPVRSPSPPDTAAFRVASLNTRQNGLVSEDRRARLARLVRAAAPDVLCIQEEYEATPRKLKTTLNKLLPTEQGEWNVHKADNCAVATRLPLEPVETDAHASTAAKVAFPSGRRLLVFSVHAQCCGYAGSERDGRRIDQIRSLVDALPRNSDASGSEPPPPTVVAGTLNPVGSKRPLTLLRSAGLRRAPLTHLDGRDALTWYAPDSSFPPGLLDLIFHRESATTFEGGFILDTRRLPAERLDRMGLRRKDSAASDHLLLVADLAWRDRGEDQPR